MPTETLRRARGLWALVVLSLSLPSACNRSPDLSELAHARLREASRAAGLAPAASRTAGPRSDSLASPLAEVLVEAAPLRISVRDLRSGETVLSSAAGVGAWIERGERILALGHVTESETDGDAMRLRVAVDGGDSVEVTIRFLTARTIEVSIDPGPTDEPVEAIGVAWATPPDESFYGLTQRLRDSPPLSHWADIGIPYDELFPPEAGTLDRRGETVEMYVRPTQSLYAPFYHSSRGYGVAVDGTTPGAFDLAASHDGVAAFRFETGTTQDARRLRFHVFLGPDHAEILDEYTRLTGRPIVPPEWVFLPWRWRGELEHGPPAELDGTRMNAQLVEDVTMFERYGIPAGVYLLDRPVLAGEYGFGRLAWDEERLPNFRESLAALRRRGYRIVVWSSTWMCGDGPDDNGTAAADRGFLAPGHDGGCSDAGGSVLDVTHPAAYAWWRDRLAAFLSAEDIDGIKLDRGEEYIPSTRSDIWADGRHGREVHNDYVVRQAELHREALEAARPNGDFVLASRAAWSGTQDDSVVWGGDIPGSEALGFGFGTDLGLRAAIIGQLRAAFLGFPIWGSDTGGYYEFKDREVFARWIEFSTFSGLMEVGGVGAHAPWDMPTEPRVDEELIEIYRRYSEIRVALADHLASLAAEAGRSGMPLVRPMVFHDRTDPVLRDLWDQYLLGPDLLVAPVWRTGEREREVYLPKGRWRSWWDAADEVVAGPRRVTVAAPLDRIPVFVRDGADVPTPPR